MCCCWNLTEAYWKYIVLSYKQCQRHIAVVKLSMLGDQNRLDVAFGFCKLEKKNQESRHRIIFLIRISLIAV